METENTKKEYVATFKHSRQISLEDWRVYCPTLKLTEKTTIKEIHEWYGKYVGSLEPLYITINSLE